MSLFVAWFVFPVPPIPRTSKSDFEFFQWRTQSLGSLSGLIACLSEFLVSKIVVITPENAKELEWLPTLLLEINNVRCPKTLNSLFGHLNK